MPSGQTTITQAYRAMLAFPHRKSNVLVTSNTAFLHCLPAAYVKELRTQPKLGFQTSNCKGIALRNDRCRLTAKPEIKRRQTGLLGTRPSQWPSRGMAIARVRCRRQSQARDHVELMRVSGCTFISCSVLRHSKILSIRSSL